MASRRPLRDPRLTPRKYLLIIVGLSLLTAEGGRGQHCLTPDAVTEAMHASGVCLATVMNPDTKGGEFQQFLLFDDQFVLLASFLG